MADFTADFEAGTNGNTITTGAGEASATAWNTVTGTPVYDDAHTYGTLAAKIESATEERLKWTSATVEHYGRVYLYATASPTGVDSFFTCSNVGFRLQWTTAGKWRIEDNAGNMLTGTVSPALNQWVRFEWHVISHITTGFAEGKLFNSPQSATPSETLTSPSTWAIGGEAEEYKFGTRTGAWGSAFWLDNIVANATSYPGRAGFFLEPPRSQYLDYEFSHP